MTLGRMMGVQYFMAYVCTMSPLKRRIFELQGRFLFILNAITAENSCHAARFAVHAHAYLPHAPHFETSQHIWLACVHDHDHAWWPLTCMHDSH